MRRQRRQQTSNLKQPESADKPRLNMPKLAQTTRRGGPGACQLAQARAALSRAALWGRRQGTLPLRVMAESKLAAKWGHGPPARAVAGPCAGASRGR